MRRGWDQRTRAGVERGWAARDHAHGCASGAREKPDPLRDTSYVPTTRRLPVRRRGERRADRGVVRGARGGLGTVDHVLLPHPDADPLFAQRRALYMQSAASPAAAVALAKSNALIDTRELLPSIRVPTLVLSRRDDPVGPEPTGRYLAERIPGARFIAFAGDEHLPWLGDAEALCAEIEQIRHWCPASGARTGSRAGNPALRPRGINKAGAHPRGRTLDRPAHGLRRCSRASRQHVRRTPRRPYR